MSKSKQQLLDERYLRMARIWAENSYCERRQGGALIVRGDAIISDGYNGTPSGLKISARTRITRRNLTCCMLRRTRSRRLRSQITAAWGQRCT